MPHADPEVRRAYQREYQRKWARENRDKRLQYERSWNERNTERRREIDTERKKAAPEKVYARNTLRRAVKLGRVAKGVCEVCGDTEVQAHHHDYSKPLEVRWLCRTHHGIEHRRYA